MASGLESPSWLEFSDRRVMEGLRAGPVEAHEIGDIAAYLLGPDGAFITGSDLLIDGGVIAAMRGSTRLSAAAPAGSGRTRGPVLRDDANCSGPVPGQCVGARARKLLSEWK